MAREQASGNKTPEVVALASDEAKKAITEVVLEEGEESSTLMRVLESKEKAPEPLLIDATRDPGKGLAAGADHEDAAFILPFKGRLAGGAHHEDGTLLNPDSYRDQRASGGRQEVILHNKTFENEESAMSCAYGKTLVSGFGEEVGGLGGG